MNILYITLFLLFVDLCTLFGRISLYVTYEAIAKLYVT